MPAGSIESEPYFESEQYANFLLHWKRKPIGFGGMAMAQSEPQNSGPAVGLVCAKTPAIQA
jgi:hypothetical protein